MREYVTRVTTFLQEVQAETKKVTWPSRQRRRGLDPGGDRGGIHHRRFPRNHRFWPIVSDRYTH